MTHPLLFSRWRSAPPTCFCHRHRRRTGWGTRSAARAVRATVYTRWAVGVRTDTATFVALIFEVPSSQNSRRLTIGKRQDHRPAPPRQRPTVWKGLSRPGRWPRTRCARSTSAQACTEKRLGRSMPQTVRKPFFRVNWTHWLSRPSWCFAVLVLWGKGG